MDHVIAAKTAAKLVVSPILNACGVYDGLLKRRLFSQPTWVILMYHRVVDHANADPFKLGMAVRKKHFEEQVRFHAERFTPITVEGAVRRIRSGKPLPKHAVSFTFDDGYRDFRAVALPILERYAVPSSLYVTTAGIEEGRPFWWDRVVNAFALTDQSELNLDFLTPGRTDHVLLLKGRQRKRSMLFTKELLWQQPPDRVEALVDELRRRLGITDDGKLHAPRMNLDDVQAASNANVELAAHCDVHTDMRLMSTERLNHELTCSRDLLRQVSGQAVNGFAYPGGRQNQAVRQMVARAGFIYAVGTRRGINRHPFDNLNLRRIGMPDIGLFDYKRCLASAAGVQAKQILRESVQWP